MMTLNEVAAALTDQIEEFVLRVKTISEYPFDEYYEGKIIVMDEEIVFLTNLRDKILGE